MRSRPLGDAAAHILRALFVQCASTDEGEEAEEETPLLFEAYLSLPAPAKVTCNFQIEERSLHGSVKITNPILPQPSLAKELKIRAKATT